jgi:hypothetical protein
MAKDPTKNMPNYKIDGGKLNEYEFTQSHGAITEEERNRFAEQQREGQENAAPPQTEAERIQQLMDDVRERVQAQEGERGRARGGKAGEGGGAKGQRGRKESGRKCRESCNCRRKHSKGRPESCGRRREESSHEEGNREERRD